MKPNIFISYSSPAGSTRHVAEIIEATLTDLSANIQILDVSRKEKHNEFKERLIETGPIDCLFIGSPVYRDMAVPPMMEFMDSLPEVDGCRAVPFITWGGAFSGIALWQMGRELIRKGFNLVGGAKVMATHSMMWSDPHPVGQGHPDADDDKMIRDFVTDIYTRLSNNHIGNLPLEQLDYNAEKHTAGIKKKMGQPWSIIPKTVNENKCTQCGLCEEVCPAGAVRMSDYPSFTKSCFDCFNCIRLCPEEAIVPGLPLEKIHAMIYDRVKTYNEKPHLQVFTA